MYSLANVREGLVREAKKGEKFDASMILSNLDNVRDGREVRS